MRIDSIDLIRFGHFANREIEFPLQNPDYQLVYGDNEAGKSTLLRGISGLLFGIPTRTPDAHSCKSSELRIGAAISSGGKSFFFRRRKGTSGTLLNLDEVQIQDQNPSAQNPSKVNQRYGDIRRRSRSSSSGSGFKYHTVTLYLVVN